MSINLSLNEDAVSDLHPAEVIVEDPKPEPTPVVNVEVTPQDSAVDHADIITKELENYDVTLQTVENGVAH